MSTEYLQGQVTTVSEEYHLLKDIVLMYLQIILTNIKRYIWQLVRRIEILSFAKKRKEPWKPQLSYSSSSFPAISLRPVIISKADQ